MNKQEDEKIVLNDGQQTALDVATTIDSHMTITGPAGTGKTFLTKLIIDQLAISFKVIATAAPTHAAKIVLSNMTGKEACTIHSLLKIHPETYEDQRQFQQSETPELDHLDVLIIDEASMYDDDLVNIMMSSLPQKCRIIAVGDKEQIQPVKHEDGRISSLFTDERFTVVELTEVVRQSADNPIIQVATDIRLGGDFSTNWDSENKQGVIEIPSAMQMVDIFLRAIKSPEDLLTHRIFCYTNKNVDIFNEIIRKHVYKTDMPFVKDEYIVLQQPVTISDGKFTETVMNNGEIVTIVNTPEPIEYDLKLARMENVTINIAKLDVKNTDGMVYSIMMPWSDKDKLAFERFLWTTTNEYRTLAKSRMLRQMWQSFWELKDAMVDTKSVGCSTIHKSQGMTLRGCAIYLSDVEAYAEPNQKKQLKYVGCTRPTKWCLFSR